MSMISATFRFTGRFDSFPKLFLFPKIVVVFSGCYTTGYSIVETERESERHPTVYAVYSMTTELTVLLPLKDVVYIYFFFILVTL